VLALELDTTASELAARLGGQVLVDDLGRRAIDRPIARALIAEHQAALAEEAAVIARAAPVAAPNPLAAHVAAVQARQAEMRADGLLGDGFATLDAIGLAEEQRSRAETGFAMLDDMRRGGSGGRFRFQP
jgi:hypothetical protein